MVIPIVSLKGGVGKSTVSINLSDMLALEEKTILIDTDQQNSIASLFCKRYKAGFSELIFEEAKLDDVIMEIEENKNLHIIPTGRYVIEHPIIYEEEFHSEKLKKIIVELEKRYKYLIFDTSPRISKPVISLLGVADFFIIVITPDPASVASLKIFLETLKEKNITADYSIIVNGMQPDQISEDFFAFIQAISHNNILGTLPRDGTVLEAAGECTTIRLYDDTSAFAKNIEKVVVNLKKRLQNL